MGTDSIFCHFCPPCSIAKTDIQTMSCFSDMSFYVRLRTNTGLMLGLLLLTSINYSHNSQDLSYFCTLELHGSIYCMHNDSNNTGYYLQKWLIKEDIPPVLLAKILFML
jgi:hypothetical protein